jgi:hypothetical protein
MFTITTITVIEPRGATDLVLIHTGGYRDVAVQPGYGPRGPVGSGPPWP